MERWRDGEMERWRDGEMERWRDGEMERWRDRERAIIVVAIHLLPFQLQTGQYLCVFISHEKYVSIINTVFAIYIMSTATKFFPFSVRNHFY